MLVLQLVTVNPNFKEINVRSNLEDLNSIFYTYQKLIKLRKENPIVVWGDFELLEDTPEEIFAYYRKHKDETWLVVANFSEETTNFSIEGVDPIDIIISNYVRNNIDLDHMQLAPYETFVVRV